MGQNGIRLAISGSTDYIPGGTRFGGVPDVPKDFRWPVFETDTFDDGEIKPRPLAFLAQFDCAEMRKLDRDGLLPETGVLSFFYEMGSMRWGYDPKDKGCARVYWFEDVNALVPAKVPENLETDYRFLPLKITAEATEMFPDYQDFSVGRPFAPKAWDAYEAACGDLGIGEPECYSRLLGWPAIIQNNMTTECELVSRGYYLGNTWKEIPETEVREAKETSLERWRLLFQLDTVADGDFELMFGDCGSIYFYIRAEDLKERRFDRVWLILQCC